MKKLNFRKVPVRYYMHNVARGFTLIELLVVIAIIAVLATIVIASLNNARGKGGDAAIKSNLANIRNQAEIIYSASGCYGDGNPVGETTCAAFAKAVCPTSGAADTLFMNSIVATQIAGAVAVSGVGNAYCSAHTNGSAWAVAVLLKSDTTKAWCVDSRGASKSVNTLGSIVNVIDETVSQCNSW